jgi:hypothetical protein
VHNFAKQDQAGKKKREISKKLIANYVFLAWDKNEKMKLLFHIFHFVFARSSLRVKLKISLRRDDAGTNESNKHNKQFTLLFPFSMLFSSSCFCCCSRCSDFYQNSQHFVRKNKNSSLTSFEETSIIKKAARAL